MTDVTSEGFSAFAEHTVVVKGTPLLSLNMRAARDPRARRAAHSYPGLWQSRTIPRPRRDTPRPGSRGDQLPIRRRRRHPERGNSELILGDGWGRAEWRASLHRYRRCAGRRREHPSSDAEILDTAAPSNSACSATATAVNGNPRLAVSLTAGPDPVARGGGVLYQLTATNRGTIPTSGA
jgi:hypothetical protein